MQIHTKKVSRVDSSKVAEVVKDVAPVVAQAAVELAPKEKKKDVKTWAAVGLSTLYIVLDLLQHLQVL